MGLKEEQGFTFYCGIFMMLQGAFTAWDPVRAMMPFQMISTALGFGTFPALSEWVRLGLGVVIVALGHIYVSLAKVGGVTEVLMRGRLLTVFNVLILVVLGKLGRYALMICLYDGVLSLLAYAARKR